MAEFIDMDYKELQRHIGEAVGALKRKAYGDGYEQGKADARAKELLDKKTRTHGQISEDMERYMEIDSMSTRGFLAESRRYAQERRDEIVAKAKADIDGLKNDSLYKVKKSNNVSLRQYNFCNAEFVVNKEKRTVVALMKGWCSGKVRSKGIAKAHPDDCFNVHIGKAIALRRALGERVPYGYISVPHPTEVRVGDVVETTEKDFPYWGNGIVTRIEKPSNLRGYFVEGGSYNFLKYAKITDDSREKEDEYVGD